MQVLLGAGVRWRYCLAIAACGALALAAPIARAAQYQGQLLYPITVPSGYDDIDTSPFQFTQGGQTVYEAESFTTFASAAYVDNLPNGAATTLNPDGYSDSDAEVVNNNIQGGYAGGSATNYYSHAFIWAGTANSGVDLNPASFESSAVYGIGGGYEVGQGTTSGGVSHALLWTGTSNAAIDLDPGNDMGSNAYGVGGNQQVGTVYTSSGAQHAALWTGSAGSFVDLNPTAVLASEATATDGTYQVGYIYTDTYSEHAAVWTGSAGSFVDLNPAGDVSSQAMAVANGEVVGYAEDADDNTEAALWNAADGTYTNLGDLLPAADQVSSEAISIDPDGTIWGIAQDSSYDTYAVEWSVVPEPASLSVLALGMALTMGRRHRRRAATAEV